jgi:HCOMODA/2-hydroxy-3-carboxy-muconic semialdehyde decarboxylase
MAMGRDLAKTLGNRPTALMRGHGCVVAADTLRKAVWISIYLELNANLQMKAMTMGDVKFLSSGEVDAVIARTSGFTVDRGWEYWCRRAGRPAGALEIN